MKYIDIHCHLDDEKYDIDRKDIIERAKKNQIGIITVGTNFSSSEKAVKIASENENIWAIIGMHPTEIANEEFNYNNYLDLAKNKKVIGIGECGYDFYREGYIGIDKQREIFEKQISIANEVKKPLMLHLRNGMKSDENAYTYAIESIKKHAKVHGNIHFFAGTLEEAKEFVNLGFRISFTGVITFARNYDEIIKSIPLNMIMSETDAPYVAPIPYRGERNEPFYIIEIVNMIAKIRNEDEEKVRQHIIDNAKSLFNI